MIVFDYEDKELGKSNFQPLCLDWIEDKAEEAKELPELSVCEVFGDDVGKILSDIAKCAHCNEWFVALNFLVLCSVLIGNKRCIRVTHEWIEPAHLWGMIVGSPSSMKTASFTVLRKCLNGLEQKREKYFDVKMAAYIENVKVINSKKDSTPEDKKLLVEQTSKPVCRQIIVNDSTVEMLAKLLQPNQPEFLENPEAVCLYRDEFGSFLKAINKYSQEDNKGFYLEGYNGGKYKILRVKYDRPINIKKLSISLLGGIQPEVLKSTISDEDNGFLSRFLFVKQEGRNDWEINDDVSVDKEWLIKLFESFDAFPGEEFNNYDEISLSEEALTAFKLWLSRHQLQYKDVVGLVESSYGKMPGQVIRIANVIEHVANAYKKIDMKVPATPPKEISLKSMAAAIKAMESYFKQTAWLVLGGIKESNSDKTLENLIRYLSVNKIDVFNWRDMVTHKRQFRLLADKKETTIDLLQAKGIISTCRLASDQESGRPADSWEVNPQLRYELPK